MAHDGFFIHPTNLFCPILALIISVPCLVHTPATARWTRAAVGLTSLSLCLYALHTTNRNSHEGQSYAEAMFAVGAHIFCRLNLEHVNPEVPKSLQTQTAWKKYMWAIDQGFTLRRTRVTDEKTAAEAKFAEKDLVLGTSSGVQTRSKAARNRSSAKGKSSTTAVTKSKPSAADASYTAYSLGGTWEEENPRLARHWRLYRLWKASIQLSIFYYLTKHSLNPYITATYDDFLPRPPILIQLLKGTLTWRIFLVRLEIVSISLLMPTLALCSGHNIASVIFGGISGGSAAWPGLYGSITQSYTMGHWYANIWHTLMRRAFTLPSRVAVKKLLGLDPSTSPLGRAIIVISAFFISGVMHTLTSWTPGMCQNLSFTEIPFHVATGVCIVCERLVIDAFVAWRKRNGWKIGPWETRMWKVVGYIWVMNWWGEAFGGAVLYPWIICRAREAAYQSRGN